MKYYKVVAFFGHQPITSLCIKSDKCMSGVRSGLEFWFLKTPWTFLIAPMGKSQKLFLNEYDNLKDIGKYLQECIKITSENPILEVQPRSTFDLKKPFETSLSMESLRSFVCAK